MSALLLFMGNHLLHKVIRAGNSQNNALSYMISHVTAKRLKIMPTFYASWECQGVLPQFNLKKSASLRKIGGAWGPTMAHTHTQKR
jgi:hypothetical protein